MDHSFELGWRTGWVKRFDDARGFGFIAMDGYKDTFFHVSALGPTQIRRGDHVRFQIGPGRDGRPVARTVEKLAGHSMRTESVVREMGIPRRGRSSEPAASSPLKGFTTGPGSPGYLKKNISFGEVAGGVTGMVLGSAMGPVGVVLGGLVGAALAGPKSSKCLRCGSVASESNRTSSRISFECRECKRFWTEPR